MAEVLKPVSACKLTHVTCYTSDRAEVTRRVEVERPDSTEFVVKVVGFPATIVEDSVRVKAQEGVTIEEVTYAVDDDDDDDEKKSKKEELVAEKKRVLRTIAELEGRRAVQERKRELAQSWCEQMLTARCQATSGPPASDDKGASSVLDFFERCGAANVKALGDVDDALDEARTARKKVEEALLKSRSPASTRSVAVAAKTTTEKPSDDDATNEEEQKKKIESPAVVFEVTYLVTRASWTPTYDVRVERSETMEVTYFGVVRQTTGEDWTDARLSLSTASPNNVGSVPPQPPTLQATWKQPHEPQRRLGGRRSLASFGTSNVAMPPAQALMPQALMPPAQALVEERDEAGEGSDDDVVEDGVCLSNGSTPTKQRAGTATFDVERLASVPGDGKEHRVQVARLDSLEPSFRHFATPALEDKAYSQARAVNSSNFVLLPSERVNVYSDGAFVAKTTLKKRCPPGDQLDVFLGVDDDVVVDFRCLNETTKTGETASVLSLAHRARTTSRLRREYVTTVHNAKPNAAVSLTLVHLLPRSTDEKITVDLLQPNDAPVSTTLAQDTFTGARGGVVRNKFTNNLVVSATLPPKTKHDFPFEYSVSWPFDAGTRHVVVE